MKEVKFYNKDGVLVDAINALGTVTACGDFMKRHHPTVPYECIDIQLNAYTRQVDGRHCRVSRLIVEDGQSVYLSIYEII